MPGTRGSWILQLKPYQFQEKGTQQLLKITEKGDPDEAAIQVSRINKNCQNGNGTRGPMKKRKEKKGSCSELSLKLISSLELHSKPTFSHAFLPRPKNILLAPFLSHVQTTRTVCLMI
jgi:hypothetical protein